jgi:hypothetical protein
MTTATANGTSTTASAGSRPIPASHPSFCEGGIGCERALIAPADWRHEGRETTWYADGTRMTLKLVRHDSRCRGGEYTRGRPSVELTVTEAECLTAEGDEITVTAELSLGRLRLLLDFLTEYERQAVEADDSTRAGVYDMPTDELPKRDGATRAQRLWNALELGAEAERLGLVREG